MITDEPKENTPRVIVVSAAIVDVAAKRLFVQRRDGSTSYPWHHCTPGGKAKKNEPDWLALCREIHEEHNVNVSAPGLVIGQAVQVYEHESKSTRADDIVTVRCYRIDSMHVYGQYSAGPSVAGFDWVTANELESLTLTPADDANRGKLMALLR